MVSVTTASTFSIDESFDELTRKLLEDFHVPGISIAIIDGDNVIPKGYGSAHLPDKPAAPETLYYIGSITKNMFATTFVKYSQAHKDITLQTKLADLIRDDFVIRDMWACNHISFEDVFCHRTGMTRHNLIFGGSTNTVKDVTRALRYLVPSTEARQQFDYCNITYAAATHAMEVKIGQPLGQTMKEQIFEPLGMLDTHTTRSSALEGGHDKVLLYDGYEWYGEHVPGARGRFVKAEHIDLQCTGGAGFVISNVLDMAKYAKAWLGHNDLLGKEVRDEVSKPRISTTKNAYNEEYAQYALGLDRRTYNGVEIIGHNGGLTGYTSLFNIVPALNFGFVALGNSYNATIVAEILFHHLLGERLHLEKEKRFDFVARYQDLLTKTYERPTLDEATKELYPSLPQKPFPLVLPIAEYAGSFRHPAYRTFTFEVKQGTKFSHEKEYLEAIVPDRAWPFILRLFHISGDYWLAYQINGLEEHEGQTVKAFQAMTKHDVDGTIKEWGLVIEPDQQRKNWKDKLLWFVRDPSKASAQK